MAGRRPSLAATGCGLLAVGLLGCGSGSGSPQTRSAPAAPLPEVTLAAPGHRPAVGEPWPIAIVARWPSGRPLRAEVRYEYLFGGAVVARRSHYRFRGTFHDVIRWPARAAGIPLTFRAIVTTPLGSRNLDYDVKVRR